MPKAAKPKRNKVVHPNSREAAKLNRKSHRENKIKKRQLEKAQKVDSIGAKLSWFQENVDGDPEKTCYSREELSELVEKYIARFNDELEQIDIVNSIGKRQGQQHIARKDAIRITVETETNLFEGPGIEIPDLLNHKNMKTFREWTGEMRFVQNIKITKFRKPKADVQQDRTEELHTEKTDEETEIREEQDDSNT